MRGPAAQRGFSLIAAVFLIVVLAALGTFAARMAVTQQETVNLALLEAQAQAAASSGIEYGANRALRANQCPLSKPLTLTATGEAGFTVVVQCTQTVHLPSGKKSYALVSTATRGRYGRADFVSRQASRTVSLLP
jgi:MSHA biogenesis protein MshP